MFCTVRLPGIHVKVKALPAVNVAVSPIQNLGLVVTGLSAGVGLTTMVCVISLEHPLAAVPVSVYTTEDNGVITSTAEVAPVFHEYAFAPVAVSVACVPAHNTAGAANDS